MKKIRSCITTFISVITKIRNKYIFKIYIKRSIKEIKRINNQKKVDLEVLNQKCTI